MKNTLKIIMMAALGFFLWSCTSNQPNAEVEKEIQSLDSISVSLDKSIEDLNQKADDVESSVDELLKEFE